MDVTSIVEQLSDLVAARPGDAPILADAIRAIEDMSDELAKIGHSHKGRLTIWHDYAPQLPLPDPTR